VAEILCTGRLAPCKHREPASDTFGTPTHVSRSSESHAFPAGGELRYSNLSAHLVAAVLATALRRGGEDRSVLDYARVKLFDPLGIQTRPAFDDPLPLQLEGSAFARAGFGWATDPRGVHIGAFGLRLTAPDMLRIGELCRAGGNWNGQQLVPAAWISESTTLNSSTAGYGYLWWVDEVDGHSHFLAAGSQGQRIVVVPDLDLVMVVVSATYDPPRMGEGIVPMLVTQVITDVG
jgi:CubicO group peptidase (beta-lactamase class C family)